MPREYRHIKQYENELLELRNQGLTYKEIADRMGFNKKQIQKFFWKAQNIRLSQSSYIAWKTRDIPQFKDCTSCNAERPNQKWVTDISYIKTAQGFLYLSIIRDLYDNSIVAYKMDNEQSIKLVLDTIKATKRKEKITAEVQLHSDQGFQYTSQAYFNLTQSYGITPSMSRRGNPYDNALAENFFSILKTECIHRVKLLQ